MGIQEMPEWKITYATIRTVKFHAENINEAADIAKRGKKEGEEIVKIELKKGKTIKYAFT